MKTHSLILIFTIIISGIIGCQTNQAPTPIDLHELTIRDIHKAFKDGKYNSQRLVSAYLERIENLDPNINAITAVNPDALTIAKELDDDYQRTKVLRPLHGIPVIVKNNIHTKGLETTAGPRQHTGAHRERVPPSSQARSRWHWFNHRTWQAPE